MYQKRMMSARRFPPPWSVEELDVCFVVRDHGGQQLAYVYFEDEPGRRSSAKLLSKDEARRIAANAASQNKTNCSVILDRADLVAICTGLGRANNDTRGLFHQRSSHVPR
jgi:hypothetical protein